MPIFEYRCSAGHVTDTFYHPTEERAERRRCGSNGCRRLARRMISTPLPPTGSLENAFDPHYNPAFGTKVESRKHYRALQKQHGTQDWRPVKGHDPVMHAVKKTGFGRRIPR